MGLIRALTPYSLNPLAVARRWVRQEAESATVRVACDVNLALALSGRSLVAGSGPRFSLAAHLPVAGLSAGPTDGRSPWEGPHHPQQSPLLRRSRA